MTDHLGFRTIIMPYLINAPQTHFAGLHKVVGSQESLHTQVVGQVL